MLPISVFLKDKIAVQDRKRVSLADQLDALDPDKLEKQLTAAAKLQQKLGLGNPTAALSGHTAKIKDKKMLVQAEKLASKFRPVKPPKESFVPRFAGSVAIAR